MNTKNLTIMSTDIVGSTGTTAALNRKDYDLFRTKYDQIMVPLIEKASGDIFKSLGDGYLASFESSTNAVLAGLNIQSQLNSMIKTLHLDQRFATRIGISSGDVVIEANDRFGVPVILAGRVQSIAEPLTTYITESVFLTMNRNEISYEDLGYISLKGFEDKTRVFKALPKGEDSLSEGLAVLCTDIRGGTGLAEGGYLEQTLAAYDEVIFKQALTHNGFFRYNLGDIYLITFKKAVNALEAAVSMAQSFDELKQQQVMVSAAFQFGIDFGYIRNILGRLYGFSISRIAPALAKASNGEIVVSAAFWQKLQEENPRSTVGIKVDSFGPLRIQGYEKSIEAFALHW